MRDDVFIDNFPFHLEFDHSAASTSVPSILTTVTSVDERALAARHRAFLAAATSDNTRQAYRSAIKHFLEWGGLLPADEAVVIRYLVHFAESLSSRTMALRLTALSQWHAYQGFADPAAGATVRKTLAGSRARTDSRGRRPRRCRSRIWSGSWRRWSALTR